MDMSIQAVTRIHRWRTIALIFIGMSLLMGLYLFQTVREEYVLNISGTEQRKDELLSFTELFINNVLTNDGEVDFETRLQLENAVRSLDDKNILTQWQNFVNSPSETEAQESVASLLRLLISEANSL